MATTAKGSQRRTARERNAGTLAISSTPMSAAEAAPALDAAHHALIPAVSLLPTTEFVTPTTLSSNPAPVPNEEPIPAENATTPADMKDVTMDLNATIENATDKSQAMFADVSDRTKGAVEKSQKMLAEVAELNKGTLEALVESSKIAARGLETMGQDAAAYAKTSFEGATQAMKTMATVKSPTEFMKLQADYVRSAFDALVAQTSRSTEASLKLAGEVAQPISNCVALAAEKIKIAA